MTTESADALQARWAQAKRVFDQLLEVPAAQRESKSAELCRGDAALAAEVASLLDAHREAGDFLSRGAEGLPSAASATADPERFGPYRRLSELGRGGMGTVYLGERVDADFEQRVAIKLIRRGLDTDAVLARFLGERRILASLDHPGIARLLDGGATEDGRPYFVLEAIEGDPLDLHCAKRGLSVEGRLRLFMEVCDAVAYAHRRLILHRDLKPGNILVDAHGKAKLLDFGIAKLLSPDLVAESTALTRPLNPAGGGGAGPMTPEFASPEQLRGDALTTASDVYSLGVVLRQLVGTGKLKRRRDLDDVIDQALALEPARRYATVEAFADDIQRYLAGEPVSAHPPSLGYRLGSFARRHRAATVSAGLLLIALAAGGLATWSQARRAERARALAQHRFDELRALARAFVFDVNDGVENLAGSTPVRERIVATALTYLDRLAEGEADQSSGDRELALELGEGYRRIGDVQGNPQMPNLGNLAGAAASYEKAAAISRALARRDQGDLEARTLLATVLLRQADVALHSAGLENAKRALDEADAAIIEALRLEPGATATRRLRAQAASRRARIERSAGSFAAALRWASAARDEIVALQARSAATRPASSPKEPPDPDLERDRLLTETDYGYTLGAAERWSEAEAVLRPALALAERRAASAPDDFSARRDLSVALERLGKVLNQLGRTDEALPLLRRIVAMDEAHLALDPRNAQTLHDIAASHDQLAQALWAAGDHPAAIAGFTRADEVLARLLAVEPNLRSVEVDRAGVISKRAQIRQESGDLTGCLADMVEALALQQAATDAEPTHPGLRYDLAVMRANTADWLLAAGRPDDAESAVREAIDQFAAYRAQAPEDAGAILGSAVSQALRGDIAWRGRRFDEACNAFAAAERDWQLYLVPLGGAPDRELAAEYRKTTSGLARCS